jgi:predicted transcriptional regulator
LRLTYGCGVNVSGSLADPRELAAEIVTVHGGDRGWLDAFTEALESSRNGDALGRVLAVWGLSQTDAGDAFGVTRQAVSKWLAAGAPSERTVAIADLAAATDILVRHLNRDRIPAVVRRPAANLGGRSLLDVLSASGARAVLEACRAMFAFEHAQS